MRSGAVLGTAAQDLVNIYSMFLYNARFYTLYSFRYCLRIVMGFVEREFNSVHSGEQ